jgi:hypothetical protein
VGKRVKGKLRFHSPLPLLIKLYCPDVKRLAYSFCKGENYDYLFSTLNKSFQWFICDCLSITEGQVLLICATLNVKREKENHVHLEEQKVLSLYSRFKNEVIIKRNKKKDWIFLLNMMLLKIWSQHNFEFWQIQVIENT